MKGKKKMWKRLLSIVLTIALALGMMPGMGLTAYADDDPYAGIKNTTTVVKFDNKDWYLIDYGDSTVTLLSKECVGASRFGSENTYDESTVESAVNDYYEKSISTDAKTAVSDNKMFLLTSAQAQTIYSANPNVLKCSQAPDTDENAWWLSSPGHDDYHAACVDGEVGYVDDDGWLVFANRGVRPALKLDLSKVTFDSVSNTFSVSNMTEYTTLQVGDVLRVGDTINSTTEYDIGGYSLEPSSGPWTMVRANFSVSGSEVNVTESATGAYYLFKGQEENHYTVGYDGQEIFGAYFTATETSDGIYVTSISGPADYQMVSFAVYEPVTGVTLTPNTAQMIDIDGIVAYTASVSPDNASDKKVKWSVGGTNADAVTLYSDETCATPVTLDTATETLTIYAKGVSAGSATVTATSNADSTKSASCDVTVNAYAGNPYASLVNTTTSVKFNDMDWYIIADDSTAVDAGTVTLLAKECIGSGSDQLRTPYANSDIKASFDAMTESGGSFSDVADAIISVDLTDVNVSGAKLYLPSNTELSGVPSDLLKCSQASGAQGNYWWLRSTAENKCWHAVNGAGGTIETSASANHTWGVRPALKLDLSKVTFDSSNKIFELMPVVEYPLWVGGVQVTSANKDDVLGDTDEGATVSYDVDTNTLTLNGVDIAEGYEDPYYNSTRGIYYSGYDGGNDSLSIVLSADSDNKVGITGNVQIGIESSRNITISGAGKLTVKGSGDYSVGIEAYALTIKDAEINVEGAFNGIQTQKYGYGVNIISGKVNATGQTGTGIHSGVRDANYQTSAVTIGENATVVAIGGNKAINYLKNAIAGTGWTDPEDNTSKTTISISSEGQSIDTLKKMAFPELPASTVTTAPEANDLTFTGSAQELVTAGTASGGTMQYALGANATTAPTTGWSTSIPTKTNAGTYYVWYKVEADDSHVSTVPVCVGGVSISPAGVTLTANSDTKAYDGTEKTVTGFTSSVNGLTFADTVTASGSGTDAGAYDVTFSGVTLNTTTDTTGNYVVTGTTKGTLTINPAGVTLTANSGTEKYDGTEKTVTGYTSSVTGLTFADTVTASGSGTNVGAYDVTFSGVTLNTTKDTTGNYVVTETTDGSLTISKRSVTLTSATAKKAYDGKPLTKNTVTVSGDGWAKGEGATYDVTGTITLPGKTDNTFTFTLKDGTKAANYSIVKRTGKLTVNDRDEEGENKKFEITVETKGDTFTYDGEEHSVEGISNLTGPIDNVTFTDNGIDFALDGVKYTVSGLSASVKGTDAGTYTSEIAGTPVVKDADDNDVTKQFKFINDPGTLTIDKRNVTLTSATSSKAYDGTPLTADEVTVSEGSFVTGEGATYNVTGSQTTVGSSNNKFTYVLNEGTKSDNYNITTVDGILTVTNRDAKYVIKPEAKSDTVLYDGKLHEINELVTDTFEVEGKTYTVSGLNVNGSGTDTGEYTVNVVGTAVVKDEAGNDVSSVFSVEPVAGKLTISKRRINLTSASASKEYDGKPLTADTVDMTGDGFIEGQGCTYKVTGTRTVVGTSENTFTFTLDEGTRAFNYDVRVTYGTLTVNNRNAAYSVTLVANSKTETYDGTEKTVTGYTINGAAGVETEDGVVTTFTASNGGTYTISGMSASLSKIEAGEYTVNITGTPVIKDSNGNDVTSQFAITIEKGTLKIEKETQAEIEETITVSEATGEDEEDGSINGLDPSKTYQYSSDDGETWTDVEPGATSISLKPGTYLIRYAGDGNNEPGKAIEVTIEAKIPEENTPTPTPTPTPSATPSAEPTATPAPTVAPTPTAAPTEAPQIDYTMSEEEKKDAELGLNAGLKVSQKGSSINISWGRVGSADGYEVYVETCSKDFGDPVKTIDKNKILDTSVKKINNKKINLKQNYKVYVAAYRIINGEKEVIAKSITAHVVGRKNAKYTNVKKIKLTKSKYTIKAGKTVKIKAKTVLVDKKKKELKKNHEVKFRYATSDSSVATVTKNGKIKGVSAGTCDIYVYARNGFAKKITVTVK